MQQLNELHQRRGRFSVFAIMTILITFCAAINNFGLFDIFFPEKVDELEPAQLEPNMSTAARSFQVV